MTTALDFSFARPNANEVVASGAAGILVYTGPARPDAGYLNDMRAHGLTVCLIQESDPNRAQEGYGAGVADAQYANRRADEVGYPINCSLCFVVSDGDAYNPSSGAGQIMQYAAGIAATGGRPRFYYGNVYATNAACAGDPLALGTWIPSTWGTATLLCQEANLPSPVPDTDLNTVLCSYGAWGDDVPTPTPPLIGDDDMPLYQTTNDGNKQFYRDAGGILVAIDNELAAKLGPYGAGLKVVDLGGALGALGYSKATVEAREKLGLH